MDDIETSVETDGVGVETDETVSETPETTPEASPGSEGGEPAAENTAEAEATAALAGETDAEAETEGGYTPNLKFRVMDKEHTIPEKFKSIMVDAESEKMVRELHEKAFGLDVVKTKFNEVREERNTYLQENTEIKRSIDSLRGIVQGAMKSGNLLKLDDFFDRLNIPQEMVMKYALAKVQFNELPPEQRQMLTENMAAERRALTLEEQNLSVQEQVAEQARAMKQMQLDYTLERAEYKSIADQWDTRVGTPGAFRNLVIRVGELAWLQSNGKTDLTPEQAVKAIIADYGLQAAAPGTATPPVQQAGAQGKRVIQRQTPTIPNLQGRSVSPLKAKPKSIDDLKALYKQHAQAE